MAKGAKKRRANRKKREMGLRVQTSCSGKNDFLPPEERGDDVFYPKTPVQASEGDEKDRISETEAGSSASQTDEPAFSQGLPIHKESAETLGFHEFDAPQMDDDTGLERLKSRGSPLRSSEAVIKWEQLVKSKEFLGGSEALESSEDIPISSSEAIIKWLGLGKLECPVPDGHEALQIPEEKNVHGNEAALGYSEQDDYETWIRSKEETVDGHGALRILQEQNGCGRDTVLCCSLQHDVETGIQSEEESVDGHAVLHISQEQNDFWNGTVLGSSLQPDVESGFQSNEETVDGHETLPMLQEQNGIERVGVLGCSEQKYVETCMHCKDKTVEEKLSCDVLTVFSDPECNAVEASSISKDETLEDVKNRGIGEGANNGNPFSSTLGEKPPLEVLAVFHDSQFGPVEASSVSHDELVLDARNNESYSVQDYVEISIQCKEETVEDVMNGCPSSALGEQPSLEMLAVFNDSELYVAKASDAPKGEVVGDVKNRDSYFEQDYVETCIQNKEEHVEDVKGSSPFSSIFQENPSLEVLAVLNDSKLNVVAANDASMDEIVEDVKNNKFYFEQDYVPTCIQCKEDTVEGVNKGDPVEDVMNGNPSYTMGEQLSLEMLAVFNDSEHDVAEASDTPKGEVLGEVKNRDSYFEQDYVKTCIQNKEDPVQDVKGSNPFSSIFGEKPSLEVLAVFNDSKLDVVEASDASKDGIVEDVKNNKSCFEQCCTQSCIQCKEETVECLKNGDCVEDVRNGHLSTLGEQPSLEMLAVFNDSEPGVAEVSDTTKGEVVWDVKNRGSCFEQDYVETCIQNKEEPVEDVQGSNPFLSIFGENPSLEVLAANNYSKLDVVEASNASKAEIVEDAKNNERCFEQDCIQSCIQCKEETVECLKNGDPAEDVRNGNPFSSILGEKPSLETLAAFKKTELDVVEGSSISRNEIVDVAENNEIYFEQDYIETCIQYKEGTLEDARSIDQVADAITNGYFFSFALGEKPTLEVPTVSNDLQHGGVEVSNISKDAIVEEIQTSESYFEQDGKNRGSVEDVENGNPSSYALGESPSLAMLAAFNISSLDLAESTNISKDEITEDVGLEKLVFAAVDNSVLNAVEAGNGSRDEIVQDAKPRGALASTLVEKPYLEVLPVSDNTQPGVELCKQSKYEDVGDVKVGDTVSSTMPDKPALEVLGLPLPAAESSPEKAEPLLADDFESLDASAGILQGAQTIHEKKPGEETDMEFSNHLQHMHSAKIMEEDKLVHVERPLTKDPYEGDQRAHVKSTLHEDPNIEDDNHFSLPPQEPLSLWKKFWKVLDCWLWFWS